jgi:hypothetical protein
LTLEALPFNVTVSVVQVSMTGGLAMATVGDRTAKLKFTVLSQPCQFSQTTE